MPPDLPRESNVARDTSTLSKTPDAPTEAKSRRLHSIDAFRGLVMLLMLLEMTHLHDLAEHFPDFSWMGMPVLEWLRFHTTHVAWEGCSLHDLIQPGFTFLVGVAMPFSIASRIRRGQSTFAMWMHAAVRSLILILLGVVLRSLGDRQTNWTFEDTLTQIGLGYFVVFLIALSPRWVHVTALGAVWIGFWMAYAIAPAPPADFDYATVGVPADWPHHHEGFASRWNKNSNLSWRADVPIMNWFPRPEPYTHNSGGYVTLSFIPTMGTMILGLLAGGWMQRDSSTSHRLIALLVAAGVCLIVGGVLGVTNICPIVKRIWTPSFGLISGGWCLACLAALHWICDVHQRHRWSFPLLVIGANSILVYVMSWTLIGSTKAMLVRHFGNGPWDLLGEAMRPQMLGAATLLIFWLVLYWLYQRRVFIRI